MQAACCLLCKVLLNMGLVADNTEFLWAQDDFSQACVTTSGGMSLQLTSAGDEELSSPTAWSSAEGCATGGGGGVGLLTAGSFAM